MWPLGFLPDPWHDSHCTLNALTEEGVAVDKSPMSWRQQYKDLGYSPEQQAASWAALDAFMARLRAGPSDDRASNALEPGNEWNGFLEAMNGYLNGTSLAKTSAADFVAFWDGSESHNWRALGVLPAVLTT